MRITRCSGDGVFTNARKASPELFAGRGIDAHREQLFGLVHDQEHRRSRCAGSGNDRKRIRRVTERGFVPVAPFASIDTRRPHRLKQHRKRIGAGLDWREISPSLAAGDCAFLEPRNQPRHDQ
jgi:hypothetical protein